MKKLISILLILSVVLLGIAVVSADEEPVAIASPDILALSEPLEDPYTPNNSYWSASVNPLGGMDFEVIGYEDAYVAVTFFANRPFSKIRMPYWAGNPDAFGGVVAGDTELCIFKAVDGKDACDYNTEDAVRSEVITTNCDNMNFEWNFEQVPGGKYCYRVTVLTEEGAYICLPGAEIIDDSIVFEVDSYRPQGSVEDAFVCYVILDEGEEVTPEPTPAPTPTLEPTATPEVTEAPEVTDAPTDAPVEPTDAPEAPTATEAPKSNSCGGFISISGLSVLALAATAVVLKKKSR